MKAKMLVIIGLILTGWASWQHLTSGFDARDLGNALFLLCGYAVITGVISVKCNLPARIISPMTFCALVGLCVIYTPIPKEDHRWIQDLASTNHIDQESLKKIIFLLCISVIVIGINVITDYLLNVFRKRPRNVNALLLPQLVVIAVLVCDVRAIMSTKKDKEENPTLAKVSRAIVSTIKVASVANIDVPKNTEQTEKHPPGRAKSISPDFDVRLNESSAKKIYADDLNHFLGGVLKGKGELFIRMGEKYKISPLFLVSIAIHESGNGTSRPARECNNPLGIMCGKNAKEHRKFDSVDDAIEFTAKQLAESGNYIRKGNCTVQKIQKVYCPVGAKNDPKKLNKGWLPGVLSWMNKIQKQTERSV